LCPEFRFYLESCFHASCLPSDDDRPRSFRDRLPACRRLRYPSLTPDGKSVVFCYRGDIWVTDTDGKSPARRLTIHEAQDTLPRVSPDGTTVAFSSVRDGSYDIYLMPITGGEATRLTHHSGLEIMCDWSPDGKTILFASNRDPSLYRIDLYEIPVAGGATRRITHDGGRGGAYSPDGKTVAYERGFNSIYWDDYEGSANYDLYTIPRAGGMPHRLRKTPGNERYPMYSADGKTLWFVTEEKKVANFFQAPSEGGGERAQVTKFTGHDVHRPCLAWDRKTVVYERWGQLYVTDLTASDPKDELLPLVVKGDRRHSGVSNRTITNGAQQIDISKDGSLMVFSLHGDIWMTSGSGGQARRLTSGPAQDEWPRISPDGRSIAFQSDRAGNSDIWIMDSRGGSLKPVTTDKSGDFFHAWHPDGTKLVFASERSGNRDIWSIELDSKTTTQLTRNNAGDDDPVYSPDGRFVAFDSSREGTQAVFIMDADGGNVRRVTSGAGFLQVPNFSPDGTMLSYEMFNPANGGSGGIFVIGTSGGPSMQVSRDGTTARWSPHGDYIYFSVGSRGREEIFRVQAPTSIENREKVPFMGEIQVDIRAELGDLFDEAWLRMGEGFYDPKMHGVDWKKMRAKYRDMAVDAENKDEFQNIIRQMLAELGASHLGINGGLRASNAVRARATPTGYLGIEFADGEGESKGRKVAVIAPKGPADEAGLRVGDEIIAIEGKKVGADTDLDALLAGTVGKEIRVRFRPITEEGLGDAREERLTPISQGKLQAMRYVQMTNTAGKTVGKETKGHVGYIHLSAMDPTNLAKFQRAVSNWNRQNRIKGMILDVRENGGGNIHQQLIQILTARPYARVKPRGAPTPIIQPALYWDKPVVVLINERSFSDAEVFPYIFKSLGVGKIVGVPTPGGVIGTNDITLADGTTFRIPRTGYFGLDGTNLEGLGVKPDVLVEMSAEDRLKGRDPQLQKAIELVMEEIKDEAKKPEAKKPEAKKPEAKKPEAATPTPTQPTPTQPKPTKPDDGARKASALDPLVDAVKGEWVRFKARMPGSEEDTILKLTVMEVRDDAVVFEREVEEGPPLAIPMPNEAPRTPLLDNLNTMGKILNQETVVADVKGERVEIAIVTLEAFGGQLRMSFTNAIPCMGLMKLEMDKTTLMEAIEWGAGTPAEESAETTPAPEKPMPETPKPEASTPAASEAAAPPAAGPANPLFDAKVGEWVRMRSVVQGEETIATLKVIEVTEDEVKLESSVAYGDTEIKGAVLTRPRRADMPLSGRGNVEVGSDTVEIGGKKLDCITITRTTRRGAVDKRWICLDIPVNGLVRHERGGKIVKELMDWGVGEPPVAHGASK
jgi:tricorn protease